MKNKIKDKIIEIPKNIIESMTLEQICREINYSGNTKALSVSLAGMGVKYKKPFKASDLIKHIKDSGDDLSNLTFNDIVKKYNYEGKQSSLQVMLWKNGIKYRRVFKSSLGFEQLAKMDTENKTVEELMELIDYKHNIHSFITTAKKYGIKHKRYSDTEGKNIYELIKKFIELDGYNLTPAEFIQKANIQKVYNPSYLVNFIKEKIEEEKEYILSISK